MASCWLCVGFLLLSLGVFLAFPISFPLSSLCCILGFSAHDESAHDEIQLGCIASLYALDLSMGHQSLEADRLWGLIMGEVIPLVGSE